MNDVQWDILTQVIEGKTVQPLPVAFIIDSPWLPGWFGVSTLDYYTSEEVWFEANLKAIASFPDVIFLPGFWSEYGMCTEPSAFGCKCVWHADSLGNPLAVMSDISAVGGLRRPNVKTDGLLPFVIQRLRHKQPAMEAAGHRIRFAVSRGPLNIASFLMGTTDFLLALKTDPDEAHRLLDLVSDFIVQWVEYQMECFPTIRGILLLDDIIGFLGEEDFGQFVLPYFQRVYGHFDAQVNFLHNDTRGLIPAKYLREMSVHLYNFSSDHSFDEIRQAAGPEVTLLGNLPPRDVLAEGTPEGVRQAVDRSLREVQEPSRLIYSCGGGMPPGVSTANIQACLEAVREASSTLSEER